MKHRLLFLCLAIAAAASAASRLSVDALPEPVRPLAEAETNVVFSAGAQGDNIWRLSIEPARGKQGHGGGAQTEDQVT